ncbi:MAG TPA: M28 family peptidase [Gemmatimonadaceae bacterium]|nr:M28 family peptidase [Gemmatimonadaceae bacterium]
MTLSRPTLRASLIVALCVPAASLAQQTNRYGNPEKHAPRPTTRAITQADLMSRLYVFADDSMEGRNAPLESNAKGTAYIVRELQRLRIAPAGPLGSYYQTLPYVQRAVSPQTTLSVNGNALATGTDFTVTSRGMTRIIDSTQVIFAGVTNDPERMIPPEWANNRFVIVVPPPPTAAGQEPAGGRGGGRGGGFGGRGGAAGGAQPVNAASRYPNATAIATVVADVRNPPPQVGFGGRGGGRGAGPSTVLNDLTATRVAAQFLITPSAAARLLGRPVDGAGPGTLGGLASAAIMYDDVQIPHASNVLAIIPGSDPVLRNEYVVISAHNDHVGVTGPNAQGQSLAVDHDSLRTARLAALRLQMQGGELRALPPGTTISVNMDSLRRIRPARRDSIRNGADDDGSGSMAVLEIAEAVAAMPTKPKRSIIFAWWTAEEDGLVGSRWWTDNPTVPLNNVVANINLDMIGRGRDEDIPGGGPDFLGYLGADRLSSVLGQRVQAVNQRQEKPLKLDNRFDWPITWPGYNNIYGRSDHAMFARYNVPIVFFFTGLHADYHQVTDEPQYIDYPHYTRIVNFVNDLAVDVANLPVRPRVDKSGAVPPRPKM